MKITREKVSEIITGFGFLFIILFFLFSIILSVIDGERYNIYVDTGSIRYQGHSYYIDNNGCVNFQGLTKYRKVCGDYTIINK